MLSQQTHKVFGHIYARIGRSMTSSVTPLEQKITDVLTTVLEPTKLEVVDTSGGCGAMYKIRVESQLFHGKPLVAQHKMVTGAIAEEIKVIHGLTITTKAIKPDDA